jgi:hypothetical protein
LVLPSNSESVSGILAGDNDVLGKLRVLVGDPCHQTLQTSFGNGQIQTRSLNQLGCQSAQMNVMRCSSDACVSEDSVGDPHCSHLANMEPIWGFLTW